MHNTPLRDAPIYLVHLDPFDEAWRQTLALAVALRALGASPVLLCREGSALAAEASSHALELRLLPHGPWRSTSVLWAFMRALREPKRPRGEQQPSCLVHACDEGASALASFCALFRKNIRIVHSRRNLDVPLKPKRALKQYRRAAVAVVTESLQGKTALLEAGMHPPLVYHVPPWVNPGLALPRRARDDGRFVFAVSGALEANAGHALLIDALVALDALAVAREERQQGQLPPWEVRVLGQGELFHSLLEDAEHKGVARHMAFLGCFEPRDMLAQCDALLVPCTQGDSGMSSILEGWATGLPVIASDRPAHRELLEADKTGLLFNPQDPRTLALRMLHLATEPEHAAALAQGGREAAAAFSARAAAVSFLQIYSMV